MKRYPSSAIAGLSIIALVACTDHGAPAPVVPALEARAAAGRTTCPGLPAGTSSLVVTPATNPTIGVGATLDFEVTNQGGMTVPDCAVTWSISDKAIASINNVGTVVGRAVGGPITVRAQASKALRGSAFITIGTPVASVSITPASATLGVGDTLRLQATVRDANGVVLSGRRVSWSSAGAAIASVSTIGLVTGSSDGKAAITATVEGKSASADITVETFPSAGLIAFLSFNGNTADSSGGGRDFTSTAATYVADRYGRPNAAAAFTGNNASATRSWSDFPHNEFTLSLWYRTDGTDLWSSYAFFLWGASPGQTNPSIFVAIDQNTIRCTAGGDGYLLVNRIENNWVQIADSSAAGGCLSRTVVSTWRHALISVANGQATIYDNGVLWKQAPVAPWSPVNTTAYLGTLHNLTPGTGAPRIIDSFAVWNRALTNGEVLRVYQSAR